jgi:hypothetical protein
MRCFLLPFTLLLAGAAFAATIPRMSFEHIVRSSPRAVRGVVARSWSSWDVTHTAIWTHYEIRVAETLRGPRASTFTISEPGGVVEGVGMAVPGAPQYSVGQEAVIFAYSTPIGYWRVRGFGQGWFRVEERDGRRIVRSPQTDALLIGARAATMKAAAEPVEDSLDGFLERVRAQILLEEGR